MQTLKIHDDLHALLKAECATRRIMLMDATAEAVLKWLEKPQIVERLWPNVQAIEPTATQADIVAEYPLPAMDREIVIWVLRNSEGAYLGTWREARCTSGGFSEMSRLD